MNLQQALESLKHGVRKKRSIRKKRLSFKSMYVDTGAHPKTHLCTQTHRLHFARGK